jgi:parvulin-like peptidyl-prolyl isomerase
MNVSMKLPKINFPTTKFPKIKLSSAFFVLILPLGILIGFFFSNITNFVSGGYKNALLPINKFLYVAKVDGVGITKGEWEKALKARYGKSAASELIDIYTVNGELKKAGIKVSEEEIDAEIATIEKQLNGQNLEALLQQEGRTLSDFRKDISLQVGMKKLLSDKVVVADAEIDAYVQSAGATLEGTTAEEKRASAKKALVEQKLGEEINKWFTDLQSKVKVENYLQ